MLPATFSSFYRSCFQTKFHRRPQKVNGMNEQWNQPESICVSYLKQITGHAPPDERFFILYVGRSAQSLCR